MATALTPESLAAPEALSLRRYAGDIILLVRMVAGITLIAAAHDLTPYLHHVGFLAGVALVTWPVRGVRWGAIYDFFLSGMLMAAVIVALQWAIEVALLGRTLNAFRAAVIAPVTEEPLKVALLVLLLLLRWRGRWTSGASDMMVCGVALGSGFGFVEDSLHGATSYPQSFGPHLFGIPLTPDAYQGFIGHGGSTGMIALAVGWALWGMRSRKWRLPALLPLAAITAWMMFDHGFSNLQNYHPGRIAQLAFEVTLRGRLAPFALVFLGLATMFVDAAVLWQMIRRLRRIGAERIFDYVRAPLAGGFGYAEVRNLVRRVRAVLLYRISRRQLAYAVAHAGGDAVEDRRRAAAAIAQAAGRVMAAQEAMSR